MADQNKPSNNNLGSTGTSPSPSLGTTGTGTGATGTSSGGRDNLDEARSHLNRAASAAADTVRGASRAARDELRSGSQGVRSELDGLAGASRAAAYDARDMADQRMQEMMEQGREMWSTAEQMIREKPLQSIGIAALAGYLIAKLR